MEGVASSSSGEACHEVRRDAGFDCECHYGLARGSVSAFLDEIRYHFRTYQHLHTWDSKLVNFPLDSLVAVTRQYLDTDDRSLNMILNHSAGEEVFTVKGTNYLHPAVEISGDISRFLLFTKVRQPLSARIILED